MTRRSFIASIETNDFMPGAFANFALGVQARYVKGVRANAEVDAIAAVAMGTKKVVKKRDLKPVDGDIGLAVSTRNSWLPRLGFVCVNCTSGAPEASREGDLQIDSVEGKKTSLHAAWQLSPGVGTFFASFAGFWDGAFAVWKWEKTASAVGYRIGEFTVSTGFSPARVGWGFQLQRGFYHIGMQYAYEKQPAYFKLERDQKLFLSLGAAL